MGRPHRLPTLAIPFLAVGALWAAGCNRPDEAEFSLVRPGMTAAEVQAMLGEPSSRRVIGEESRATLGYAERWHWGDTLSTRATDALFADQPDERVFVVFFDAAGRVLATQAPQAPLRGRDESSPDRTGRPGTIEPAIDDL